MDLRVPVRDKEMDKDKGMDKEVGLDKEMDMDQRQVQAMAKEVDMVLLDKEMDMVLLDKEMDMVLLDKHYLFKMKKEVQIIELIKIKKET